VAKNIVLLSDGTGNSAASAQKTNVWRLYQALDCAEQIPVGQSRQIAHYDDGVGTGSFRPVALVGLAIGLGVWTNVRDLYTYLCRNYEDGDRIYLFGFSRGAFTVRLLSGLIRRCGLVTWDTEQQLLERVGAAYNAYRRDFLYRAAAPEHRPAMALQRAIVRPPEYEPDTFKSKIKLPFEHRRPHIAFLGVWDTVDAYGMPVDEWKIGIDRFVWPVSVADRYLSSGIDKVCHALSLDDERPTFRPVLWTEEGYRYGEPPGDRLEQVWFAGVHANVGGGYPVDGLAYFTLDWMMSKTDLRFLPSARQEVADRADREGRYYNSRSGLAGYYRYGPRSVERLCNDTQYGVSIKAPKIHQGAIDRIAAREVAYAPVSLPQSYQIVGTNTPPAVLAPKQDWMEFALDKVWWRRVAYFATVLISAILVLFPFLRWAGWLDKTLGTVTARLCSWSGEALCRLPGEIIASGVSFLEKLGLKDPGKSIYQMIDSLAPGWAKFWLDSFKDYPVAVGILALILAWLFFLKSGQLQAQIARRAEYAWAGYKRITPVPAPDPGFSDRVARFMRTYVQNAMHFIVRRIIPGFFGLFTWLLLVLAVVITFPLSLYALYKFWKFVRGNQAEAAL
jgi:uncharacterized protein (DUF2235 family)